MLGALAECIPYLRRIEAEGRNDFERDEARTALAYRLATTGQVRGALQAVAAGRTFVLEAMARSNGVDRHRPTAVALAAARRVEDPFTRRFLLAWYDDVAGAAAADAALPAEGRDPAAENMYRLLVAAAQGRRREALEAARAQVQRNQALGEVNYDAQYLLAEALLESGDDAGAAAVAGSYPDPALAAAVKVSFEGFPDLALVRARAKANLGRTEEAVRELDAILSFWREADQDLPRLIEVKALRARLAGAAR
jgi:hypothetical protein